LAWIKEIGQHFGLIAHGCDKLLKFKKGARYLASWTAPALFLKRGPLPLFILGFLEPRHPEVRASLVVLLPHSHLCTLIYCNYLFNPMEDTNSCPAFIERQEGPFTTTFEIQHSPNLSRLSMRFGSSVLNGDKENDENCTPLRLDSPPTPPYRKNYHRSPKRTPPSPTVLRSILVIAVQWVI
jgi:hypothetical protein